MPLEELRQLADVYGLIKSDYVEPVEDKKLLTEAISGMVASLDPHSAYLDKKPPTANCAKAPKASSSASASRSARATTAISRSSRRSRIRRPGAPASRRAT
jgi:C-terminal processing protease CtpA/Prc